MSLKSAAQEPVVVNLQDLSKPTTPTEVQKLPPEAVHIESQDHNIASALAEAKKIAQEAVHVDLQDLNRASTPFEAKKSARNEQVGFSKPALTITISEWAAGVVPKSPVAIAELLALHGEGIDTGEVVKRHMSPANTPTLHQDWMAEGTSAMVSTKMSSDTKTDPAVLSKKMASETATEQFPLYVEPKTDTANEATGTKVLPPAVEQSKGDLKQAVDDFFNRIDDALDNCWMDEPNTLDNPDALHDKEPETSKGKGKQKETKQETSAVEQGEFYKKQLIFAARNKAKTKEQKDAEREATLRTMWELSRMRGDV